MSSSTPPCTGSKKYEEAASAAGSDSPSSRTSTRLTSPIAPASSRRRSSRYAGSKRAFMASMNNAPHPRAVSAIARISSAESAAGFSQSTALPAASARAAHTRCSPCGNAR